MKLFQEKFNLFATPAIILSVIIGANIYQKACSTSTANVIADGLIRDITSDIISSSDEPLKSMNHLNVLKASFDNAGLVNIFVFDKQRNLIVGTEEKTFEDLDIARHKKNHQYGNNLLITRKLSYVDYLGSSKAISSLKKTNTDIETNLKIAQTQFKKIEGALIVYDFSTVKNNTTNNITHKFEFQLIVFFLTLMVVLSGWVNHQLIAKRLNIKLHRTNKKIRKLLADKKELEQQLEKIKESDLKESIRKNQTTNFLVNICHDIKTPINVLIAEVQINNLDNPILRSAEKQLNLLIDDLASASRITNGDFQFKKEIINWNIAVSDAIELSRSAQRTSRGNKHYCEFITLTSSIYVENAVSDERRIKQILSNLINNAIKYSKSSTIITHTNYIKINNEDYIECTVIDYGLGIRKSIQRSVFEAFTQLNESKQLMDTGHGLGLSIIKTFAEKMKGTVNIHSNDPSGLRVGFRIPVNSAETDIIKHSIENLRTGELVAIISSCPELAFAISQKLYKCKTIHYLSISELKRDNSTKYSIQHVVLGIDSIDNTEDMDHLELHSLGTTAKIYGPIERSRELFSEWGRYSFESLSILNNNWSTIDSEPAKRILVIEDIPTNIAQYRNLCRDLNYSLSLCLNSQQAKVLLNSQKFDLVFIDILIDEDECLDYGYDLSIHKKFTVNSDTPFIAVTGTAFDEVINFYIRCDINATITKAKGISENERETVAKILQNPKLSYGDKLYFEGEKSNKLEQILIELRECHDLIEIHKLLINAAKEADTEFLNQTVQQVWRYLERPENNHLIEHCKLSVLDYFLGKAQPS